MELCELASNIFKCLQSLDRHDMFQDMFQHLFVVMGESPWYAASFLAAMWEWIPQRRCGILLTSRVTEIPEML